MRPKNIQIIISDNSILHDTFPEAELISQESNLEHYKKIDLLIVDKIISEPAIDKIIKITDKIINLSAEVSIEGAIVFLKPFRLHNLVEIINQQQRKDIIFCLINNEILYSQKGSYINYSNKQISLTDKENDLLASLILAPNHSLTKENLLTKVWLYAKTTETTTVDIHLSRLRSILPDGFLNIKDGNASLGVFDLK